MNENKNNKKNVVQQSSYKNITKYVLAMVIGV